jgi:hypothetical protein
MNLRLLVSKEMNDYMQFMGDKYFLSIKIDNCVDYLRNCYYPDFNGFNTKQRRDFGISHTKKLSCRIFLMDPIIRRWVHTGERQWKY